MLPISPETLPRLVFEFLLAVTNPHAGGGQASIVQLHRQLIVTKC
jgi:hypothetical protein